MRAPRRRSNWAASNNPRTLTLCTRTCLPCVQFAEFSLPYAERITKALKARYPHVPVILHGNGGTGEQRGSSEGTVDR